MEEMFQQVWSSFLRVGEKVFEMLEGGISLADFETKLKEELGGLGQQITRLVIEAADERLRERPQDRPGFVVVRREDPKEVLSPFGMLRYHRTYFQHKLTGQYRYLVDEVVGLKPHQRIDPVVRAELVEGATDRSYRASGRWTSANDCHVSGQTVMKTVLGMDVAEEIARDRPKRHVKYLFIEADEDHVANQTGASWQPRLAYVHEGRYQAGSRGQLRNVRYFGGYIGKTEALWASVWRYLDETYELDEVEAIMVSGDGDSWIKQACEYIPGSVFLLDRYHALQYVTAAVGTDRKLQSQLWRALTEADRKAVRACLQEAYEKAESPGRCRNIENADRYFRKQWDGIKAWLIYKDVWPGCSAEGHVSHIYSTRMSSRPMAWRRAGVEQMSRLRVLKANGGSIKETYLKQHTKTQPLVQVAERWLKNARQSFKDNSTWPQAWENNIPLLNGGRSQLRRILRSIIDAS